jgi:hypothetical protein
MGRTHAKFVLGFLGGFADWREMFSGEKDDLARTQGRKKEGYGQA